MNKTFTNQVINLSLYKSYFNVGGIQKFCRNLYKAFPEKKFVEFYENQFFNIFNWDKKIKFSNVEYLNVKNLSKYKFNKCIILVSDFKESMFDFLLSASANNDIYFVDHGMGHLYKNNLPNTAWSKFKLLTANPTLKTNLATSNCFNEIVFAPYDWSEITEFSCKSFENRQDILYLGRNTISKNKNRDQKNISSLLKINSNLTNCKIDFYTFPKLFHKNYKGFLKNDLKHETISRYRFLILFSNFEGSPIVLNEALASGTPIIVSNGWKLNGEIEKTSSWVRFNLDNIESVSEWINKNFENEKLWNKMHKEALSFSVKNSINFYQKKWNKIFNV